jgi:hypothetical protein
MNKKTLQIIGLLMLLAGSLLFLFLGIMAFWGDLEATLFKTTVSSQETLTTLKCPVIITPNEEASITGLFTNTSDKPATLQIRTYVTDGYVVLMKEYKAYISLDPGQAELVEVPIAADDAAFGRFVLVRMHQLRWRQVPSRSASCGVVVLDVPYLSGSQLIAIITILGLILIPGGFLLWLKHSKPFIDGQQKALWRIVFFALISGLTALTGVLGLWLLSFFFTIVWILMAVSIIQHLVISA